MRSGRWRLTTAALVAAASVCCKEKHQQGREATGARGPEGPQKPAPAAQPQSLECSEFSPGKKLGEVESRRLNEASGLVASRGAARVLWSHNDAGGRPRLFAMTRTGKALGRYRVKGAKSMDWEDIALGPGPEPGKWLLYVGDIGGNRSVRHDVVVYRVPEPEVDLEQKPKKRKLKNAVRFRLRYPDGISRDAETLMVDPHTSDLYVATKTFGAEAEAYQARAPLDEHKINVMQQVATLRPTGGSASSALFTGGDIAADGSAILIRTYADAFLWLRRSGESIADALERKPCRIPLRAESQGEAIAFAPEGDGFLTVSEGANPAIYFFERLP